MQEINVDFHIHSKYSGGTSPEMNIPNLAKGGEDKGLDIIGTGDCTHGGWLTHLEKNLQEVADGIYRYSTEKTRFIISGEVEDKNRVHHLILFPSLHSARRFREAIKASSVDIDDDGRPHVRMGGEELVDLSNDCDAMIGPCHAFTPWTSIYKEHDSLKDCYGDNLRYIKFLELGLSADSRMADKVEELNDLTFMSNSDAHSPWPHRIGREFNRIRVSEGSFEEIRKAIEGKAGREFSLNVGLNPKEGKYHETACTRCYMKFKVEDAMKLNRRCPDCGGRIKKGVKERIMELSKGRSSVHPGKRPPYIDTVPLAEIIAMSLGIKSMLSKKVQARWQEMIKTFGPETGILIDADISELRAFDEKVATMIEAFRLGRMAYDSGGGGRYGRPVFGREVKEKFYDDSQRALSDFYCNDNA